MSRVVRVSRFARGRVTKRTATLPTIFRKRRFPRERLFSVCRSFILLIQTNALDRSFMARGWHVFSRRGFFLAISFRGRWEEGPLGEMRKSAEVGRTLSNGRPVNRKRTRWPRFAFSGRERCLARVRAISLNDLAASMSHVTYTECAIRTRMCSHELIRVRLDPIRSPVTPYDIIRYDAIRYETTRHDTKRYDTRYYCRADHGAARAKRCAYRIRVVAIDTRAATDNASTTTTPISCNEPDARSKEIRTLSVTWRKMNVRSEWKRRYRGATVLFGFVLVPSRCNEQRAVLASSEEPRVLRSRRNFSVTVVRRYSVGGLCQARFPHDLALVTRKKAKANDAVAV